MINAPKTTQPTPMAIVDLDAIAHNIAVLRERAGSAAVMAVVKADGYGHGAPEVARAALSAPWVLTRRTVRPLTRPSLLLVARRPE